MHNHGFKLGARNVHCWGVLAQILGPGLEELACIMSSLALYIVTHDLGVKLGINSGRQKESKVGLVDVCIHTRMGSNSVMPVMRRSPDIMLDYG